MNKPFRRTFEAPEDAGAAAEDEAPDFSARIEFESAPEALGRRMREASQPAEPDTEPPPAAAAPEAPAEEAAPEPAAGGLPDDAPPLYEILDDGRIRLQNGHEYANVQALAEAQWHAQNFISRGGHKQQQEPQQPQWDESQQYQEEQPERLLTAGQPLGGAPTTVEELVSWAEANPTAAGRWAVQNQDKVDPDVVSAVYNHWVQSNPADAHHYNLQLEEARRKADQEALEQRIRAEYQPILERHRTEELNQAQAALDALPLWNHYQPRVAQWVAEQGPEYAAWFETDLSPQEQYQELFERYSVLRVTDANSAAANGQPVPDVGDAVQQAAHQAAQPKGPPVTEGRGGARPAPEPNDDIALVRRGAKAFIGAGDMFNGPPS